MPPFRVVVVPTMVVVGAAVVEPVPLATGATGPAPSMSPPMMAACRAYEPPTTMTAERRLGVLSSGTNDWYVSAATVSRT